MSTNNLEEKTDGRSIIVDDVNQYKSALVENFIPRKSNGLAGNEAGGLGTETIQWLDAFIASGFWNAGDIKAHHTYNGIAEINQGWFPCTGDIINETNYDIVHGAGSWSSYIASSSFEGKYSPNLIGKYLTGNSSTVYDGSVPIPSVGNISNEKNIQHDHSVDYHTHQWHIKDGGSSSAQGYMWTFGTYYDRSYNSSGVLSESITTSPSTRLDDLYTSRETSATSSSLSTTQSIQPDSIEVIFYLRII